MLQETLMEIIIGTLAAVGGICILKSVYDIIFIDPIFKNCNARMTLVADGHSADTELILRAAQQVKKLYFPGMRIVFVDNCEQPAEGYNYAQKFSESFNIDYRAPHQP